MVAWVKRQVLVGAVVGAALAPGRAEACGGGGVTTTKTTSAEVAVANTQRIVLALHGAGTPEASTDIIVQLGVPKTSVDYGVLIPVPGEPVIHPEPISARDLDALDRATAPTIVTQTEVYSPDSSSGFSCGCGSGAGGNDVASAPLTVSVSAPVNVGPVTVVVLKSDDGSALTDWLAENGFAIPSEHLALVDSYVASGHEFIAVRRSDTAPAGGDSSLGLHYTLSGDHRQLSLAFARLGAAPTVAFTVFVAAPTWVGPGQGFVMLNLTSLDESELRQKTYSRAVTNAVERYGGHAFVVEGTFGYPPGLSDGFKALLGLDPSAANRLTRASTIVAADALDTDVRFDVPITDQPNRRTLSVGGTASEASVGLLSLVALARALRRRFRRGRVDA